MKQGTLMTRILYATVIFPLLLVLAAPVNAEQDLFRKALKSDKQGFLNDAVADWQKFLASQPEKDRRIFAQIKLSIVYLKLEQPRKALDTAKELLNFAPDNFHANFNAGNVLSGLRNYADAAKAYETTVRLKPDKGLGYVGQALCRFGNKNPDKAIALLREAKSVFKKKKNISWHRDTRIMINQIRTFEKYPPNFSNLWLTNNLKTVRETYEKRILRKFRKSLTRQLSGR